MPKETHERWEDAEKLISKGVDNLAEGLWVLQEIWDSCQDGSLEKSALCDLQSYGDGPLTEIENIMGSIKLLKVIPGLGEAGKRKELCRLKFGNAVGCLYNSLEHIEEAIGTLKGMSGEGIEESGLMEILYGLKGRIMDAEESMRAWEAENGFWIRRLNGHD